MKKYLDNSLSFAEYTELIDRLLASGKTTGPDQSESLVGYGRLNRARMQRLSKTIELDETVRAQMGALSVDWIWLVITEGWCGDAAQNIPVIEKLAKANPGIETRYVLRDENADLMDRFLTNGTRSIPKLIAIDRRTMRVLGTWGPRPRMAQEIFDKQKTAGIDKPLILEDIQRWYHADRGRSLQTEFVDLALWWSRASYALAA